MMKIEQDKLSIFHHGGSKRNLHPEASRRNLNPEAERSNDKISPMRN